MGKDARYYLWGSRVKQDAECTHQGFVHLAQLVDADGSGLLTIGFSTNPPARMARLRAQMGRGNVKIRLLGVFAGTRPDSTRLQQKLRKRFENYNGHIGLAHGWREWFTDAPEVRDAFDAAAAAHGGLMDWRGLKFPVGATAR